MSASIDINSASWKLVEVGRIVHFRTGPYAGRLAAIVEIIDHKRVLLDGPSKEAHVPRHSASLSYVLLTPIVIENLPRGIRSGPLLKKWNEADVDAKWAQSAPAKTRARTERRRQLTDFERFKVMLLKKEARANVRKASADMRRAAK